MTISGKIKSLISSVRWDEVKDEAVSLLQKLIRIDTTNPPGNEKPAAELMQNYFADFGIKSKIVESEPGRASIIAEVQGEREDDKKPLILLSHLDVVPANPAEWTYHPFSGEVKDGYVWGRGAIDCKGLAVCEAVALALITRMKIPLERGVKFISVADEEMGGEKGAAYLIQTENIDGFGVVNEGGSGAILGGRRLYFPCFGEKGPLWLKVRAKGKAGHASMPHKDNPNTILIKSLYKILKSDLGKKLTDNFLVSFRTHLIPGPAKGLSPLFSFLCRSEYAKGFLGRVLFQLSRVKPKLSAMFSNTVSITMINSGYKENVIPEEAEAVLDIRLLPSYDPFEIIEKMKKIIDDPRISFEIIAMYKSSESDPSSEFFMILKNAVRAVYEHTFVPVIAPGFTDSRYFREKGIPAYGLLPFFLTDEEISTMHGVNERVSLENLETGVKLMMSIIMHMCCKDLGGL